jgi:hypothetical protein
MAMIEKPRRSTQRTMPARRNAIDRATSRPGRQRIARSRWRSDSATIVLRCITTKAVRQHNQATSGVAYEHCRHGSISDVFYLHAAGWSGRL